MGAVLSSLAFAARAAESIPKIGFLGYDSAVQAPRIAALREGLRALGYIEGKNIVIDQRWAEGKFDRLPQLAAELVADKVSVIVTAAPPLIQAARQATSTIPIVILTNNPVSQGFAGSFAHPGGNITGVAFQGDELGMKQLSSLRDVVPGLLRVAILWNREGSGTEALAAVESAAQTLGLQARVFEVRNAAEISAQVRAAKSWGAQGLIEIAAPLLTANRKVLIAELAANRLPASCGLRDYVVDGCLMTYTADLDALFRQMAPFVVRILKGANPADLPIEQPREFVFVINKTTADALGLKIPKWVEIQMSEPYL